MALSAALMDTPITYGQLEEIEDQFEDVEIEIIRQQDKSTKDLYEKRQKLVAQIPNFWPLVFEQAPPDIDEYIQPSDSALLLNHLTGLHVSRFELPHGDPRSLAIRFEFSENEYFSDTTLEKKFWWRRCKDGWAGYVGEPVVINWKEGKDLTTGMLDLVKKVWSEDRAAPGGKTSEETESKKELVKLMEGTGLGGVSFFAWFGFCGRKVTAEEDIEATKLEAEKRAKRQAGEEVPEDDLDDEDDDNDEYEYEIFPTGDDLAVAIAEDLWPGAIKYFTQAQEQDALSDIDFESDEEMGDGDDEEGEGKGDDPPSKKRKA